MSRGNPGFYEVVDFHSFCSSLDNYIVIRITIVVLARTSDHQVTLPSGFKSFTGPRGFQTRGFPQLRYFFTEKLYDIIALTSGEKINVF